MNSHGITMAELLKQVRQAELGERTTVGPKVKVSEDELTDPNATGDDPELLKGIKKKLDPKKDKGCLLYTSPSPRDLSTSRMPSSA